MIALTFGNDMAQRPEMAIDTAARSAKIVSERIS
jgi:hypothetical protein